MKNYILLLLIALAGCMQHPPTPASQAVTVGAVKYNATFTGVVTLTPFDGTTLPADTIVVIPPIPSTGNADKVGLKVFPWTGLQRVKDLGITSVSCYLPIHWFATEKGLHCEPFWQAYTNEAPGLDTYLGQAKQLGMRVHLVANQCPEWIRKVGNGTGGNDYPPIPDGLDRKNPASYAKVADVYGQLAMRYGKVKHDASKLRIDATQQYPNQPITPTGSGLDMPVSLAFGNELDHWFEGFNSPKYLKADEHAALLVACVKAVRSADPSMEYYMAGLTDFQFDYLKEVYRVYCVLWPEGKAYFPNVDCHHYSNILNKPGSDKPTWAQDGGCYPENDAAFSQINQIVAWAHSIGKKCIVSEFGYDKKPPSMMHIVGRGITDAQAQGVGIVKTYQALLAAGVDGAYCFEAADEGVGGGQFTTCGLFGTQANGFPPFESATMVKTMISQIRTPGQPMQSLVFMSQQTEVPGTLQAGQTIRVGDMRERAHKFPSPTGK